MRDVRNIRILSFLSDKNNKQFVKYADAKLLREYYHISQLSPNLQEAIYLALGVVLSELSDTYDIDISHAINSSDILDDYAVLLVDMDQLQLKPRITYKTKNAQPSQQVLSVQNSKPQSFSSPNARPSVIAWLNNITASQALKAAQINFDGIITAQNSPDQINRIMLNTIAKQKQKQKIYQRYLKLRQLCRKHHYKRKKLEQKVDLICQDIVKSNVQLGATLERLRKAYDFQNSLTGEFDLRYMLHKALRHIKENIDDSNATIYLTEHDDFEAHIFGPWYDNEPDIQQIENTLRQTIVDHVLQNQQILLVADAADLAFANATQRDELAGLSLLAVPVTHRHQLIAILIIYRNAEMPLEENAQQSAMLFVKPLASAIAALSKLQGIIAT